MKGVQICILLLSTVVIVLAHTSLLKHHQNRIINGQSVNITEANYYTLITCGGFICGGTILKHNRVITAGHCVYNCKPDNTTIFVGLNSLKEIHTAPRYNVSQIKLHPKYNSSIYRAYDVAILCISTNITFTPKTGPIKYANFVPQPGSFIQVYGYGETASEEVSQTLQTTTLKIFKNVETIIIIKVANTSVYYGDSGGPAVYNGQLVGVISSILFNNTKSPQTATGNVIVQCGNPEIYNFIKDNVENTP